MYLLAMTPRFIQQCNIYFLAYIREAKVLHNNTILGSIYLPHKITENCIYIPNPIVGCGQQTALLKLILRSFCRVIQTKTNSVFINVTLSLQSVTSLTFNATLLPLLLCFLNNISFNSSVMIRKSNRNSRFFYD